MSRSGSISESRSLLSQDSRGTPYCSLRMLVLFTRLFAALYFRAPGMQRPSRPPSSGSYLSSSIRRHLISWTYFSARWRISSSMGSGLGGSWHTGTSFVTFCQHYFLDIVFSPLRVCQRCTATTDLPERQIGVLDSGPSRQFSSRWVRRKQYRQPWRTRHWQLMSLQGYMILRSCPVMRAMIRHMLRTLRVHTMERPVGHSRFLRHR